MASGEFGNSVPEFELAFFKNGLMYEIAQASLTQSAELSPEDVANIIVPPRGQAEHQTPRWTVIEDAGSAKVTAAARRGREILQLAEQLDMRRGESLSDVDKSRISPTQAVWVVEGGGNKSSVVRRNLALDAMKLVYGEEVLPNHRLVQIGANRPIPALKKEKPNSEYEIGKEISGEFFPKDGELTEFGLNIASALAGSWRRIGAEFRAKNRAARIQRAVHMVKSGMPELIQIQPANTGGSGFAAGLSAAQSLMGSLEKKQLVVVTNGPYTPKDEFLANRWASVNKVRMLQPVAIGDEAGYKTSHMGRELVTADRKLMAYVIEMAKLYRLKHHDYEQL